METKYGKANRVWVMDRGMVSEKNLEFMRASGARYLVGTPKSLLKKFEQHLLDQDWQKGRPGIEVKFCPGTEETFVLCRSLGRKEKENAILNRFVARLEEKLTKLAERAAQGKVRGKQKVERQIGRLLERTNAVISILTHDAHNVPFKKAFHRLSCDFTYDLLSNSRAASLFAVTVTEKDVRLS